MPTHQAPQAVISADSEQTRENKVVRPVSPPLDSRSPRSETSARTLEATRQSVAAGRDFTTSTLRAWRVDHLAEDVRLVVSEFLTNALGATGKTWYGPRAGRPDTPEPDHLDGPESCPVGLHLTRDDTHLLCVVTDPSDDAPIRKEPDFVHESGRGLFLVEAHSCTWGWTPHPSGGKAVWALFRL